MTRTNHGRMAVFAALVALIPATAVGSQPSGTPTGAVEIDVLKEVYLDCERAAVHGDLDTGAIMHCSEVYEELKRRAFGGDFRRLKAWADAHTATEDVSDGPAAFPGRKAGAAD